MIPLGDKLKAQRPAVITWLIIAANIGVFVKELQLGPAVERFIYRYALVPAHWRFGGWQDASELPALFSTLITSQFLHAGWLHLISNMLYLWIFGNNVEDRLGHVRFLFFYLLCGIASGGSQLLVNQRSTIPMVGASGAIAGVLGAYLILFPSAKIITLVPLGLWWEKIEMPAVVFLGIWFVLQWMEGISTVGQISDVGGVAFWAHIGGFVAGMIGSVMALPRRRG